MHQKLLENPEELLVAPYGKVKALNFYEDVLPSGEIKRMRSENSDEFISKESYYSILLSRNIHPRTRPTKMVQEKSVKKHRLVKFTEKFKEQAVSGEPNKLFDASEPKPHAETPETDELRMEDSEQPNAHRYPTRKRRPPERFADYLNEEILDDYDICSYVNGPLTHQEAVNGVDAECWRQAMDEEINTLKANDSFVIAKIPSGKKAVGGKWVYTVKGDPDNPIYKARYVAKDIAKRKE